jgi:hypothetical protein
MIASQKGAPMSIEGKWNAKIQSPMGEQAATLELTDAGGVLSGSFTSPQGSAEVSGKIDGDAVEFSGTVQSPMGAVELNFSGTLSGDEISGEVQFGSFGSGSWSAIRS